MNVERNLSLSFSHAAPHEEFDSVNPMSGVISKMTAAVFDPSMRNNTIKYNETGIKNVGSRLKTFE